VWGFHLHTTSPNDNSSNKFQIWIMNNANYPAQATFVTKLLTTHFAFK